MPDNQVNPRSLSLYRVNLYYIKATCREGSIKMIKAIVFDFDGLIIDTETVWYHSYQQALGEVGIAFPMDVFARCVGTHDDELIRFVEEQAGSAERAETIRANAASLHEHLMASVEAREGVRNFLDEAQTTGIKIGLATSSDRRWIDRFLGRLDLEDYFEVIVTRDDVANIKPDPELYRKAVQALGVLPSEAVAFEDSVNGAKAAKAAGLHCVIVPNPVTEQLAFERYELRIRSMGDHKLSDLLTQLEKSVQGADDNGL
jgi:putative hydrolase of the HAD superfamily